MVTMLVTRPEPDAQLTAARLEAIAVKPLVTPLLNMLVLPASLPPPSGFASIAVTSANAFRALSERGVIEDWLGIPVFSVGDRTADAARDYGFTDVRSAHGSLTDLVDMLLTEEIAGPIFNPAARHQSSDLGRLLAPSGRMVVTARIYEMAAATTLPDAALEALTRGEISAVLHYSRRSAEIFAQLAAPVLSAPERERLVMLCLAEQVAQPLLAAHFPRIALADHPSEDAMMALALTFAREQ